MRVEAMEVLTNVSSAEEHWGDERLDHYSAQKMSMIELRLMSQSIECFEAMRHHCTVLSDFDEKGDCLWPMRTSYDIHVRLVRTLMRTYSTMRDDVASKVSRLVFHEAWRRHFRGVSAGSRLHKKMLYLRELWATYEKVSKISEGETFVKGHEQFFEGHFARPEWFFELQEDPCAWREVLTVVRSNEQLALESLLTLKDEYLREMMAEVEADEHVPAVAESSEP